ncbi:MurR/RpiR family transcriptional regulator [Salininema proteolyticum]|uniref:MurR/RpiR family transcriptional regulator n=1 Tax=Salininema proteolyticum TaxID=1607685 RepID=A0ABV8U4G9_9ACTN
MSVLSDVRGIADGLTDAVARVAQYILADPARAAQSTITDLAEASGTSPGTVTRFCRQAGYPGYAALRLAIATEIGRASAETGWESGIGSAIAPDDGLDKVVKQLAALDTALLRETSDSLDLEAVDRAVEAAIGASRIDVYGIGASACVARELHTGFYRTGLAAWLWTEVHDGLASAALLGPGDIAFAVSHSGTTAETVEMLRQAGRAGAATVAITSYPHSPIAEAADHVLTSASHSTNHRADLLAARYSQLLVADLVYIAVAQRRFPETVDAFESRAEAVREHRPAARTTTAQEQP